MRDDFASADVKKLTGTPFYRAKLDYENRVLLRFAEYAGKRACLALELIEHHAYDRSRFYRVTYGKSSPTSTATGSSTRTSWG